LINSMKPGSSHGSNNQNDEVLERISKEYGAEEKNREPVKKLGKDEFFKIMVTQIQHQDPLKPYQNEEMAAQMAQFTALEQTMNINQNLEKLLNAQQPLQNLGASHLIGKYVTADSSRVLHNEGKYTEVGFDLAEDAANVHLSIINERGENVRELELSDLKKGPNTIKWDGKKVNNLAAPSGNYMVQIQAKAKNERSIGVKTQKTDVVHGIVFEGKETVLLVGDLKHPQKMFLKNVHKVVDASGAGQPQKQAVAQPSPDAGVPDPIALSGFPAGMEIGGLENLIEKQQQELAEKQKATAAEIEAADNDRVPGINVGESGKFAQVDGMQFKRGDAKAPSAPSNLSEDEIRKLIAAGPDLSGANPAAAAMKEAKAAPSNSAPGQSVPSSTEQSTAGQWTQ